MHGPRIPGGHSRIQSDHTRILGHHIKILLRGPLEVASVRQIVLTKPEKVAARALEVLVEQLFVLTGALFL